MPGRKELRSIRIKRESVNGTPVTPRFLWRGNGETIEDQREVKQVEEQIGVFGGSDRTYIPKLMAGLELADTPATFEQLSDLFLMLGFGTSGGNVSGSAQGASGSTSVHTLIAPTTTAFPTNSYTIEAGNGTAANDGWTEVMEYTLAEEVKLSFKGAEAMMVSASLIGRQGTAANRSGTFNAVGTLPAVETILAGRGSFWLSPVAGAFGVGQVTAGNILAGEISYKTTWALKYSVDGGLLTYATAVYAGLEITGNLTLEAQTSGTFGAWGSAGQKEKWRAEQPQLLQATWRGGAITEGTTYLNKELTIQHPIKFESFDALDDQDGNDTVQVAFFSKFNETTPAAGRGTVIIARQGTSEFAGA